LNGGDEIILCDFGIAAHPETMTHLFVGSRNYMSPEVFENKLYDFKTDIWSFGCVVFEMLTLEKAFNGNSLLAIGLKVKECQINMPKCSETRIEYLMKK
jgi:serine/threonine protein kinase